MAYVLCVLDDYGCRHPLKMCNTYCFYKATMVTRTRLNNTFVPALSVLFQRSDLSSFPLAQMLTHYKTVVCGLCDLTIVNSITALQQAKSRFLQFPLFQSRISTIFFSRLGKYKHSGVSGRWQTGHFSYTQSLVPLRCFQDTWAVNHMRDHSHSLTNITGGDEG